MTAGDTAARRADAGPTSPPAGTEHARDDLLRRAAALVAAAARVRVTADEEAVHDLRVAARRLEVALRVWAPAGPARVRAAAQRARRSARRLRRAAGGVRELEVHVGLLERQLARARTGSSLEPLLHGLRAKRDRARVRAAGLCRPRRLDRIADASACVAAAIGGNPALLADADARVATAREVATARLSRAAGAADDTRLHAARVALKKWRYAAESRAAAPAAHPSAPLARLRAAQKALGEVHDRAVLRDLLRRWAKRAGHRDDPALAQSLRALHAGVERARRALLRGIPQRLRTLVRAARR